MGGGLTTTAQGGPSSPELMSGLFGRRGALEPIRRRSPSQTAVLLDSGYRSRTAAFRSRRRGVREVARREEESRRRSRTERRTRHVFFFLCTTQGCQRPYRCAPTAPAVAARRQRRCGGNRGPAAFFSNEARTHTPQGSPRSPQAAVRPRCREPRSRRVSHGRRRHQPSESRSGGVGVAATHAAHRPQPSNALKREHFGSLSLVTHRRSALSSTRTWRWARRSCSAGRRPTSPCSPRAAPRSARSPRSDDGGGCCSGDCCAGGGRRARPAASW